jgi:uncharacterized protein (TIGR00297 family)
MIGRTFAAVGLGSAVAAAGYRRGALSGSGAAGAAMIGALTVRAGSWRWSAPLLAFFVGSSALSALEHRSKGGKAIAAYSTRGAGRDIHQVLANGGPAALAALGHIVVPHRVWAAAFAGAFAAANGDTWATELGALSSVPPRMVLTGRSAAPGTSGAITSLGVAASVAGSALIGVTAGLTMESGPFDVRRALGVSLAGMTGALTDSLAGATIQVAYQCPQCGAGTERRTHCAGLRTIRTRGIPWCNNDAVNALCTSVGALVAVVLTADR